MIVENTNTMIIIWLIEHTSLRFKFVMGLLIKKKKKCHGTKILVAHFLREFLRTKKELYRCKRVLNASKA